jgi:hypothetical protein
MGVFMAEARNDRRKPRRHAADVSESAIAFSPCAVRQFRALLPQQRVRLKKLLTNPVRKDETSADTWFRLQRASEFRDFEVRIEDLRVFCRAVKRQLRVVLLGSKRGQWLLISGVKLTL